MNTKTTKSQREAVFEDLRMESAHAHFDAICFIEDYLSPIPLDRVARGVSREQAEALECILLNVRNAIDKFGKPGAIEGYIEQGMVQDVIFTCGKFHEQIVCLINKLDATRIAQCIGKTLAKRITSANLLSLLFLSHGGYLSEDAYRWIEKERKNHEWASKKKAEEFARRMEEREAEGEPEDDMDEDEDFDDRDMLIYDALVQIQRTLDSIDWEVERRCIGADALDKISDAYVLSEIGEDAVTGSAPLDELRNEFENIVGDE